ncbi:family 78 glycoside hydrolase catalytic domain [Halobacteria archaeon AArc-m2/3/4]|uniref:alpha-L-rhamnosidase n=1 Tax=Natronoglomus mannanivorans TaxID=2979990 RepID=A0ABT2QKL9_9EURY|nr:family 78 glycoside hydrolase catalytic domain [Halobacteria archaeon AArc-m2/3/4]
MSSPSSLPAVLDLRVEYETDPINARPEAPRFSWRATSPGKGSTQSAYRLLVARSRESIEKRTGDLWDTGRVDRSTSTNVEYDGISLESGTDYYWTVRVWDENGVASDWAACATFSTAIAENDWDGAWIGHQPDLGDTNGYRSHWRPPDDDSREWVQIDLGESVDVREIELHPAAPFDGLETPDGHPVTAYYSHDDSPRPDAPHGVGFPVRYRVEVADDPAFADAHTVVDRTDDDQPNPSPDSVTVNADSATGRFVRVTATDLYEFDPATTPREEFSSTKPDYRPEERRPWKLFALAAIAVRDDDGEDLAKGRPVTASSSIEEETWGTSHLVNGRYRPHVDSTSPLLRTEVKLGDVARARAHVCTLGYGELYVNGERLGEAVLDPAWTQYDERVLYNTYDVTDALEAGENAIGLWLGRGWFGRNAVNWSGYGSPRAIVQLDVEYADGTTKSVTTDSSWRATESPIVRNDIYAGETYDARREQPGWAAPQFDDSEWDDASVVGASGGRLAPQRTPPIRVTETIEPESVTKRESGSIIDFGENLVGRLALTIRGANDGDEIALEHAEALDERGELSVVDLRTADATDRYIAGGADVETYRPRFTYHGFRYAKVTGYPGELSDDDVRAERVHTDVEPIGTFECSNEDVTRIQENAERGLRGNLHGVLTDCPQRDERFGWTGDNHIAAPTVMYNFDATLFYEKWMDDHADVRSEHGYVADTVPYGYGTKPEDPTWGITQVTVPWHLYRHYGDVGVLERHYEGMRRYVDYWFDRCEDGILPDEYANYGDWLAFENAEGRRGLPYDLFNTAFHYHTTNCFTQIASILGNDADATRYASRAEFIADAFTDEFFDESSHRYGPGTQSSYAVPLFVGLVPDEQVDAVVAGLVEKVRSDGSKLRTGFLGTRPLIHALVEHGYEDLAYEVITQPEQPGWMYMVHQGATTMWERWDSDEQVGSGMNSLNHSPFTFVSEWFYERLAGLRIDESMHETGRVEIDPAFVDDLEWVEGALETVNGRLASRWERTAEGIALSVEIPWNTVATVSLPSIDDEAAITEGGDPVWDGEASASLPAGVTSVGTDGGFLAIEIGSGSYEFEITSI